MYSADFLPQSSLKMAPAGQMPAAIHTAGFAGQCFVIEDF